MAYASQSSFKFRLNAYLSFQHPTPPSPTILKSITRPPSLSPFFVSTGTTCGSHAYPPLHIRIMLWTTCCCRHKHMSYTTPSMIPPRMVLGSAFISTCWFYFCLHIHFYDILHSHLGCIIYNGNDPHGDDICLSMIIQIPFKCLPLLARSS